MRLDRNITKPRRGKYALIKLRQETNSPIFAGEATADVKGGYGAVYQPVLKEAIDFGDTQDTDFFVIRIKDRYAYAALKAYALAAFEDGNVEYAMDVMALAKAAREHPLKATPD